MPDKTVITSVGNPMPAGARGGSAPEFKVSPGRVVIEHIQPEVDGGRFPIKRIAGEEVRVSVDIFADGHDRLTARLLSREEGSAWQESPLQPQGNDRWTGVFTPKRVGRAYYTVEAWIDHFATWRDAFRKKREAGQDLSVEFLIGANHIKAAAERSSGRDRQTLLHWLDEIRSPATSDAYRSNLVLDPELERLMQRYPDRGAATRWERELVVVIDPARAGFSSWYEFFPRSTSSRPGVHGSLRDAAAHLSYVAEMGFNVVYLPPIHPIGSAYRKGKNNAPHSEPGEVGSPWAIGSTEGGHTAIHPELGTVADFRAFVARAKELGLDVALDIAFQASPDHPYVKEHPEWFRWRPDKTVQYAENPPKKYQDIYPFDFENADWRAMWRELRDVFLYWIEQGVSVFRVDNPHTKPFAFWEWLIADIKSMHPQTIFLSEAFTRPKIMYRLAKVGFTQSYTYFAWRSNKADLMEYMRELTETDVREFFRPNFWPNTPDILTEELQSGRRGAFVSRIVLAATLSSNYGIYGPAYELMEHQPLATGKEEYLDSEKYQLKEWPLDRADSLKSLITRLNAARNTHIALQSDRGLQFHEIDNDRLLAYSKATPDGRDVIVTIVNLDPVWRQSGWVRLPLESFHLDPLRPFLLHDLLSGARYEWFGPVNYVELDPGRINAHIFHLEQGR